MHYAVARSILALLTVGAIAWTVYARIQLGEEATTSQVLRRIFDKCPQTGILLMLVAYRLIADCLPDTDGWVVLLTIVACYCLGHALWGY